MSLDSNSNLPGNGKLPGHRPGPFDRTHGPEHAEGLPGKVFSFHIVPLDPVYKAGLAGHVRS